MLNTTDKVTRLASLMLLSSFCSSLIFPVLPLAVLAWGGNSADGGLLVSAYGIASMTSAPLLGRLSDRLGQRRVLVSCYMLSALSYVGLASAATMMSAYCLRISGGVAAGAVAVLQAAALDAAGNDGAKGLSRLSAFGALGYMLGPVLAALLAVGRDLTLVSLISAGGAMVQMLWVRGAIAGSRRISYEQIKSKKLPRSQQLRRTIQLFSLCVIAAVQAGLFAMAGYFCAQELNWRARELAMLLAEGAISVAVFQFFLLRPLISRIGVHSAVLFACTIGFLAAIMLTLLPVMALMLVLATPFLFIATSAASTCLLTAYAQDCGEDNRATKIGISTMITNLGQIAGPILFGIAMVAFSRQILFLGATVGFLLVGGGHILLRVITGSKK